MTQSRLIELSYYDPAAQVRLSAYADTVVLDHNSKGGVISAVRFGGYPEMVRAMSDAIYGGATIEATQNSTTRMLQSNVKGYQRQLSHDGVYAVATLMASDDAQTDNGSANDGSDGELEDQEAMQPRKCYIFCPQGDRDRLFEELDHKTAAPLIPAFRDYVLDALQRELKKSGIRVGEFFPAFLGRLQLRVNYRNHRKIVVIDGKVGYVGGFNIGKEYISRDTKFGYWRDTHLKIRGSAVYSLQIRFALDWNYAVKENLFTDGKYFGLSDEDMLRNTAEMEDTVQIEKGDGVKSGNVGIQIISSGPDASNRQIRNNYLQLFHKAKHHIYIQTPYFVPDDAVLSALKIAAESGVDVRLMIPCKPDHPFVYWASYSYVGDLLAAGARCYTYENGFLHAKAVMVDGMVSCCGTANMDIRSFELNFEVNATIFDADVTRKLEEAFIRDLDHCLEVTKERYGARNLMVRVKEQCSRLLSPLL